MLSDPERVLLQALDVVLEQLRDIKEEDTQTSRQIRDLKAQVNRYEVELSKAREENPGLIEKLTQSSNNYPTITLAMVEAAQNRMAELKYTVPYGVVREACYAAYNARNQL